MYFIDEFKKINSQSGGGKFIQSGEWKNDRKLFNVSNTLLCKAILENSLTVLECVTGDKELGYFPHVDERIKTTVIPTGESLVIQRLKPILFDIFHGITLGNGTALTTDNINRDTNEKLYGAVSQLI